MVTLFDVTSMTITRWSKSGKLPPPSGYDKNHPYWLYGAVRDLLPKGEGVS
jgi:hypothetical protein